ncbi:hypothetical protein [Nocardioides sp. AN3]
MRASDTVSTHKGDGGLHIAGFRSAVERSPHQHFPLRPYDLGEVLGQAQEQAPVQFVIAVLVNVVDLHLGRQQDICDKVSRRIGCAPVGDGSLRNWHVRLLPRVGRLLNPKRYLF